MEIKGLGGKQSARTIEQFDISHWNISIECRRADENAIILAFIETANKLGASFREVGEGPTHSQGRLCPACNRIVHLMSRDCALCGARDIR